MTRTNWVRGENRDRLEKDVTERKEKNGDALDINGDPISNWRIFPTKVDILPSVFHSYSHPNPKKRCRLYNGDRGKKRLLKSSEVEFLVDLYARVDQVNTEMDRSEVVDVIMEMNQNISQKAVTLHLKRILLPVNAEPGIVRENLVKIQATTSNQSEINLSKQYRWHVLVGGVYNIMRIESTGLGKKSGKSFGEVMQHFIVGIDEMCIMTDAHGDLRVIGAASKIKHEAIIADR